MRRPLLTIGIPTYNRAHTVSANLAGIVDALPDWVEILICDNASDPPVELDTAIRAAAEARGVRIRTYRHAVNLGAPANILRLFELVETEWMLLAGDDDPVLPERLNDILQLIERRNQCAVIKFSSPYGHYASETLASDFNELMRAGGDFNQLLFMSTFLFKIDACRPYLRFAYMMALSAASQVALLLMVSLSGGTIALSPLVITRARGGEPAWSPADTRLNFYNLADLPLSPEQRKLLLAKIYCGHNLFREVLDIAAIAAGNRGEGAYIRHKARMVHWVYGRGLKKWAAQLLVPASVLVGPKMLALLKHLYERRKGRPYLHVFVNRHDRL